MRHRVLLLGLGFWGGRWLKIIMDSPRCELAGVAGSREELNGAAAQYGLESGLMHTDYREAIQNSGAHIAVVVLPGALHFDADRLALEAGMHIITEKPLAMNLEEAEMLLKLQAQKYPNQKFMASQNYRWRPHNRTIKKAIEDGMIGNAESVLLEFRQQEDLQGYRGDLRYPLLEDMSIHHFDLLRFFIGSDCEEAICHAWRPSWSLYPGMPNADALLQMRNGVCVTYHASWAARGKETSSDGNFSITGEKGCITLDADDTVRFFAHNKADSVALDTSAQEGVILPHVQMERTEMAYGLEMFMDCVENNLMPETTLEDNIKSYNMVAACLRSEKEGRSVLCG